MDLAWISKVAKLIRQGVMETEEEELRGETGEEQSLTWMRSRIPSSLSEESTQKTK